MELASSGYIVGYFYREAKHLLSSVRVRAGRNNWYHDKLDPLLSNTTAPLRLRARNEGRDFGI
jgi:hypothetical protein